MNQPTFKFMIPRHFEKRCKDKKLTPRETEVAKLMVVGEPQKNIACSLGIALKTVEKHIRVIHLKLGFCSTVECIIFFLR